MRAVVVYESMFGSTRAIAEAIAAGIGEGAVVVPVGGATRDVVKHAELLVAGGPTHAHGMTSKQSRAGSPQYVEKSHGDLELEPDFEGPGLRDWFHDQPGRPLPAAAFDTRVSGPELLTGRASKGIASRLHSHGCTLVAKPESFLVDRDHHLLDGELERARAWGAALVAQVPRNA
jgi:hypothetical protein